MDVPALVELLRGKRFVALTGAGISTESGIPDYRGPETRHRPRNPIQHRAFVNEAAARVRYWARSVLGWPRFRSFTPNVAHSALQALERAGHCSTILTQNVDRLHHKAGSAQVLELHGSLFEVRCLSCGDVEPRDQLQHRLLELNPHAATWPYALAPDGDADIPEAALQEFTLASCLTCAGVLKPDVVFFGDNVPPRRVEASFKAVEDADALLVVGSSLTVWSGYRFAVRAAERGLPVAIVNLGETRADSLATLRLDASAGQVLPELCTALRIIPR